jgi:hypothetical protein
MDQETLKKISSPEVQRYIRENEKVDVNALILKHKTILDVPSSLIVDQLSGRRKSKEKIPSFHESEIIYPPGINLEQSSSEKTATFKTKVFLEALSSRKNLIDLTGGFGVDSFFLSKIFKSVYYVEPNADLLEIVKGNHATLGAFNISHYNNTAETFLAEGQESSAIFIDPSRRSESKKVYAFHDCAPDIVSLKDEIFNAADFLLVKASPLLDLKLAISELSFVKKVFVLSVDNEVKELLFLCKKGFQDEPVIDAINLKDETSESFAFKFSEEALIESSFSDPKAFLYEPNASILKAGAFKSIANKFHLAKIQVSTHLYTSDLLVPEFPGRIFKIVSEVKGEKKELLQYFPGGKANVTTRNYPLSVDELKKKTGLNDGGDKYLLGFSGQQKKFLVAAERIK